MSRRESIRLAAGRLRTAAGSIRRSTRRLAQAAGSLWRSVRPRSRREAALDLTGIVVVAAILAGAFFVGATTLWSPYVESVVRPDENARTWAALEPTYAGAAICQKCHAVEAAKAAVGGHTGIGCESCHGALLDHALASPDAAVLALAGPATLQLATQLSVPTDQLCTKCHIATVGRPAAIRQIVPADHYVSECLQCHDPHTGISRRPPVVVHPLENLPACITCHGPDGFKARNQRHPTVSGDEPCLACHAPGRGPEGR